MANFEAFRLNFSSSTNPEIGRSARLNILLFPYISGCPHNSEFIGDGVCDDHLKFNKQCNFDGGDCCKQDWIGDGVCDNFNMFQSCGDFDGGDCAFGSTIDNKEI